VLGVLLKPIALSLTLLKRRTPTERHRYSCGFERFLAEMKAQNERLHPEMQAIPARSRSIETR
jgi:ferredoxin-NADP reductase